METEVGEIKIHGFTVIQEGRKEPWVGFPRKAGKKDGKWFPVFEADGELRRLIVAAVLDAYNAMGKRG
jgi:DNA-binding cell septation regulator SpoVG